MPCSLTISARRSGIMRRAPSTPPTSAMTPTFSTLRSYPMSTIAAIVNTMPAAIDSPDEPVV